LVVPLSWRKKKEKEGEGFRVQLVAQEYQGGEKGQYGVEKK